MQCFLYYTQIQAPWLQLVVIMVKMCNLWFPYSCHLYMAVLLPLWFDNHFLNCFLLVTWCPAGLPISKCSQVRTSTSRRIIIVVVSWLIVWLVTNSFLKPNYVQLQVLSAACNKVQISCRHNLSIYAQILARVRCSGYCKVYRKLLIDTEITECLYMYVELAWDHRQNHIIYVHVHS